jgi:hypothetical protein
VLWYTINQYNNENDEIRRTIEETVRIVLTMLKYENSHNKKVTPNDELASMLVANHATLILQSAFSSSSSLNTLDSLVVVHSGPIHIDNKQHSAIATGVPDSLLTQAKIFVIPVPVTTIEIEKIITYSTNFIFYFNFLFSSYFKIC